MDVDRNSRTVQSPEQDAGHRSQLGVISHAGQEITLDGVDYLIMKEDEVLAAIGASPDSADSADRNRREKE